MPDYEIVCLTRCWACQFGEHFDPPQAHTWMDKEDAEHSGHAWPLPAEIAAANLCACKCAGGPGGCHAIEADEKYAEEIAKRLSMEDLFAVPARDEKEETR